LKGSHTQPDGDWRNLDSKNPYYGQFSNPFGDWSNQGINPFFNPSSR